MPATSRTLLRAALLANIVNFVLGGIVGVGVRGSDAAGDSFSLVFFLGITSALKARMFSLSTQFTDSTAEDAVMAYVQQARLEEVAVDV